MEQSKWRSAQVIIDFNIMKKILCCVFLFILQCAVARAVFAVGDVFIVSQVRGEEQCCQPGSLDNFQYQLSQLEKHHFPGSFLFRYDALTNEQMVQTFSEAKKLNPNLTAGLWVEITPALATASGIFYRGNEANWSKAEHSLLVGYTTDERELLLDTLIAQFHQSFPDEPLLIAGAWGIDTNSLNYLEEQGVRVWQTVREQWSIDDYTVDGSVVNKPYFPSQNWYLNPSDQARNIVVVKHTISDPLKNYGDTTSSFTSQPNDFNRANFTVENYFTPLLNQAMNNEGWATIGLENSMAREFQEQFGQQLAIVADKAASSEAKVVSINELIDRFIIKKEAAETTISMARDLLNSSQPLTAFWVETANYRLRFRFTNNGLILDDVRAYSGEFTDYYNDHQAQNGFYGIIPSVFSTQFSHKLIHRGNGKSLETYTVAPDEAPQVGLVFPAAKLDTIQISEEANFKTISYLTNDAQRIQFNFESKQWTSNVKGEEINSGEWSWQNADYPSRQVSVSASDGYVYSYSINAEELNTARQKYKQLLLPEIIPGKPSIAQSFFDWRNPYTLVDVLPARLVLYPLDDENYSVLPENLKIVTKPDITSTISEQMGEYIFIDFHSSQTQKVNVKIYFGEDLADEKNIYFVADCGSDITKCGLNPVSWWRWLQWKIQNRSSEA